MAYTPCRYARRWPELFAPLDDDQKWSVSQALANGRLEGWEPTREEVADLIDRAREVISADEYRARVLDRARAAAADPVAADRAATG